MQNGLKNNQFLKTGLAAVPWLKAGVSLLDFFSGGGKTAPQTVQLMPMAVNLSMRLNGTITTSNQYHNIIFSNPGSLDAKNDPDIYPFYNEVLGVFNLLNGPKFLLQQTWRQDPMYYQGITTYTFKLKEAMKFVVNPASNLQLQDAQVAYVGLSNEISSTPPTTIGHKFDYIEGKDPETNKWEYRTEYISTACLGNDHGFFYEFVGNGPVPSKFYLKFILNFKRLDNPSAQNVLLVLKYPIKIETVTTGLPRTEFNPSSCSGGMISQASSSDINTFCTNSNYTTNRQARISPSVLSTLEDDKNIIITPNPAKSYINVSGNTKKDKITLIEILNSNGVLVVRKSVSKTGDFSEVLNVSSFPNGTYLIKFTYSNKKYGIKKFIKG